MFPEAFTAVELVIVVVLVVLPQRKSVTSASAKNPEGKVCAPENAAEAELDSITRGAVHRIVVRAVANATLSPRIVTPPEQLPDAVPPIVLVSLALPLPSETPFVPPSSVTVFAAKTFTWFRTRPAVGAVAPVVPIMLTLPPAPVALMVRKLAPLLFEEMKPHWPDPLPLTFVPVMDIADEDVFEEVIVEAAVAAPPCISTPNAPEVFVFPSAVPEIVMVPAPELMVCPCIIVMPLA